MIFFFGMLAIEPNKKKKISYQYTVVSDVYQYGIYI